MEREIEDAVAPGDAEFLDATALATALMGDSIATNLFMVGFAFQRGLIPLSRSGDHARDRAERRRGRVQHGRASSGAAAPRPTRRGAPARPAADGAAGVAAPVRQRSTKSIARRADFLTGYQDAAYAQRYTDFVARVRAAEAAQGPGRDRARPRPSRATTSSCSRSRTSTRSRGSTRRATSRARRRAVRGRLHAALPPRAAALRHARPVDRRADEAQPTGRG